MTVLWILLVPIIWLFIAKYIFRTTFNWKEFGISVAIVSIFTIGAWQISKFSQTIDFEIWNGYITNKKRVHDSYVETYECNCYTTCSGSGNSQVCTQHCSICTEDHYTVKWYAESTVGEIQFKYRDSTSKSVYNEPDPPAYKNCKIGEPAAQEYRYTNYIRAVPESLFNDNGTTASEQFVGKIPPYPRVYNFYKVRRVLNIGATIPKNAIDKINDGLSNELKTLGTMKQANIIVILTSISDPSYRYAVEQAWLGGKKNDIVVFVGLNQNKIIWSDVMTWALNSGNELFQVTLRDEIMKQKVLDPDKFVSLVSNTVLKLYDRPQMKDYEYLADEVKPPLWVVLILVILAFGGSAILTYIFHKHEI